MMESHLRRFLSSKRERTSLQIDREDPRDASRQSTSSSKPPSIFSYRTSASGNGIKETALEQHGSQLQAIPYEKTSAGKAPTFVSKPARGNGPVKLQTSRRLSSGELLLTTQDDQTTKDDIREGEDVVGGKYRRKSAARVLKSADPQEAPATPAGQSDAVSFSFSSVHSPLKTAQSISTLATTDIVPFSATSTGVLDHEPSIHSVAASLDDSSADQTNRCSFGTSSVSRLQRDPEAASLHMPRIEEQNPTIAALWRAEQSRLVDMYGQQGLRRNAHQNVATNRWSPPGPPVPPKDQKQTTPSVTDPLRQPSLKKHSVEVRRSSNTSALYGDETSDTSSNKRVSLISSCAGSSSFTSHTTATDYDSVVTRDDIRKIVDEMRSTYLRAFESNTPTSYKSQSQASRKKRRTKASASNMDSNIMVSTTGLERQTWHGQNDSTHQKPHKRQKKRVVSQPAIGSRDLTPTEGTRATRPARPTQRLHRADSTTLGSFVANIRHESHDSDHLSIDEKISAPSTTSFQPKDVAIPSISLDDFPSTPRRTPSRPLAISNKLEQ